MYISIQTKYKSASPCVFILHQYIPCILQTYTYIYNWYLAYTCINLLFSGFHGTHRSQAQPSDGLEENVRRTWWSWFWYSLYTNSVWKAATVAQTTEWLAELWTLLYHSCIDIVVQLINNLTCRDLHIRCADKLVPRSRVFMDFLIRFYRWTVQSIWNSLWQVQGQGRTFLDM